MEDDHRRFEFTTPNPFDHKPKFRFCSAYPRQTVICIFNKLINKTNSQVIRDPHCVRETFHFSLRGKLCNRRHLRCGRSSTFFALQHEHERNTRLNNIPSWIGWSASPRDSPDFVCYLDRSAFAKWILKKKTGPVIFNPKLEYCYMIR